MFLKIFMFEKKKFKKENNKRIDERINIYDKGLGCYNMKKEIKTKRMSKKEHKKESIKCNTICLKHGRVEGFIKKKFILVLFYYL